MERKGREMERKGREMERKGSEGTNCFLDISDR